MKKKWLKEPLNAIFKGLFVILSIFWLFISLSFAVNCFSRVYLYPLGEKETVIKYSNYYGLDSKMVFSIIKIESGFDANAKSSAGAVGLMQITPETGEYIAKLQGVQDYDLINPKTNVNFGCFYIKYLLSRFNDIQTVLCAYNAGEGNVSNWLKNQEYSKDGKTLYHIPFAETSNYIKKFHKTFAKYNKLYGKILDK